MSPGTDAFLAAVLGAVVAAGLTPLVIRLALRTDVMDHPGPLKPHAAPVPYLGGLAVFGGIVAGLMVSQHPIVVVPLAGALLLGLVDDITSLGVVPRFVTEVAIGIGVAWSVGSDDAVLFIALVLGTVVMINAVNFVDGIDGLASGVCAVSFIGCAVVLPGSWAVPAAAAAGAAVGFLLFNRPPARIYLGDAGSYLLGTGLAVAVGAQLASGGQAAGGLLGTEVEGSAVVVAVALLFYPVVELGSTVLRRLTTHRPLFAGDRDHVYDQLVQHGVRGPTTTSVLVGAQAVVVLAAVAVDRLDSVVASVALAAVVLVAIIVAAVPRGARRT